MSTFSDMSEILKILITSCLTVFVGVVVFCATQLILKLIIEPIHAQAKVIGKIYYTLIYYANVYAAPLASDSGNDFAKREHWDATNEFRECASNLLAATWAIRFYGWLEKLRFIPTKANVKEAAGHLLRISHSFFSDSQGQGRENLKDAAKIKILLKLPGSNQN